MKHDIKFRNIQDNNSAEYQAQAKNLLEKFKNFSALVQQYNQECGIYSGRKDGKLVGLRLAFVSDEANLLFSSKIKEIAFNSDAQGALFAKANRTKEILKQSHARFLHANQGLKTKIPSTHSSSQSRAR